MTHDPQWLIDEEAQHERDAEVLARNIVNTAHAIGSYRGQNILKWEDQSDDEHDLMIGVAHHLLRFRIVEMVSIEQRVRERVYGALPAPTVDRNE